MWKLFLVLLISPIIAFAQKRVNTPETKHPSDRYYISDFEPGVVVMADSTVKPGLLRFNGNLFFKEHVDGKREKLAAKEVLKFIAGRDTFVVSRNISTAGAPLFGPHVPDVAFFKQLARGEASLYLHRSQSSSHSMGVGMGGMGTGVMFVQSSNVPNYFISLKDSAFVYIPPRKKKFLTTVLNLVQDNEQLVDDIKQGVLGYADIDEIVRRYNLYSQQGG